jgi:hypothetical protein
MAQKQSIRTWHMRKSGYVAVWVTFLSFWGGIVFAGAILGVRGFGLPPAEVQTAPPQAPQVPVARIQLIPDSNDLCRALIFHNDSGRYQDGGTGKCTIPRDMLVWTVHSRAEAFAQAFRSSWKGDAVASSLH